MEICQQTGKVIHKTKKDAISILAFLKKNKKPEKIYHYCEFCKGYHLSGMPYKKKQK